MSVRRACRMNRSIVAVDIDDVLAAEAEYIIDYSNRHWGYNLTIDDYREDWLFWQLDYADPEFEKRATELHQPDALRAYRVIPGAYDVLEKLKNNHDLIAVTSRRKNIEEATRSWLDEYFSGIFSDVIFTGFYDDPTREGRHLLSKGDLLSELGVKYLIDDQPKHCSGAASYGIDAVMFGDYAENRAVDVPDRVTRCHDWHAVAEYFGV